MSDNAYMSEAIALSAEALEKEGAKPFGAVVVKDGRVVGRGLNRSVANFDPTSHGETEAIRDACKNLGTLDLSGCDLYTSCEPCPICVATLASVGISRLFYGATLEEAVRVLAPVPAEVRSNAGIAKMRRWCSVSAAERDHPSKQIDEDRAMAVLENWARLKSG